MTTSRAPLAEAAAGSVPRKNGRPKAMTIRASAARRSINSSQWRMRRRWTD
jgi:hypothetical protein